MSAESTLSGMTKPENPSVGAPQRVRRRIAVAAFGGWNDAGEAATGAVEHLLHAWPHRRLRTVSSEDYVDFQVNRPELVIDDHGRRALTWPDTTIGLVSPPSGPEIVLISGPEPSIRWRAFSAEILAVLSDAGVGTLVTLGSMLADAPHSRPLPVSVSVQETPYEPAPPNSYEGPVGIPSVLGQAAVEAGLRLVSAWVQVPHYVSQNPSPKAVLALVRAVQEQLTAVVPLHDLEEEAAAWQRGVDELARTDPDVADYVAQLERAQDAAELPAATGDAIAEEFERFLRRRRDED